MFTATITPDGQPSFEVTATSRDILAWEKTHRGRTVGQLERNASMTAITELIYVACKRRGFFTGQESEFVETCDVDLHTPVSDAEVGPTGVAR